MKVVRSMSACLALWGLAVPAHAAGAAAATGPVKLDRCEVTARNDAVVLLVCAPGANPENWRASGKAACAGQPECNAWIWDDASKAPKAAPATSKDMPKDAARYAKAIWLNDAEQMVQIRPAAR